MPAAEKEPEAARDELLAIVAEIRERVRARYPSGSAGLPLPDLTPILHARDAAQAKVAAIGTVNPRPPGLLNSLIQAVKRLVARSLDWHVREQVEFNAGMVAAIEAVLEALNETNRVLARLAALQPVAQELKDLHSHLVESAREWERKVAVNETQFLRSVADLQTAFQHRATLMESNFRELLQAQHRDFTGALEQTTSDIQKRLWADMERIRAAYESLIHTELRLVRQRAALARPPAAVPAAAPEPAPALAIDALHFANRFRGSQEYVRRNQQIYAGRFEGSSDVLDVGCGRGEFLELLKERGIAARGVDWNEESVALCRQRGLEAEQADLFEYLDGLADQSLGGLFCAQVVEHLPPERLPELIRLAHAKLRRNGLLAVETPNPECLAIFATHFFLDPTHTRPVPPALMVFYLEEQGFGQVEVLRLSPAVESNPALASLPEDFRQAFFGALDYAVFARRLS